MAKMRNVSIAIAGVACVAIGSAVAPNSAQAAIITGSITGILDEYTSGSFNLGDVFTAEYSYNDAATVPYDLSHDPSDPDVRDVGFNVPLNSLKVTVGSAYSHIFDFSDPSSSFGEFSFQDLAYLPPTYVPLSSSKTAGVTAHDGFDTANSNRFSAYRARDQYDGFPLSFVSHSVDAGYSSVDPNTGLHVEQAYGSTHSNDVTFSPDLTTTAVPTPALLPGLIALGASILRQRKKECAQFQYLSHRQKLIIRVVNDYPVF